MHMGTGTLALRSGRVVEVTYQFGTAVDDIRAGTLICDVSQLDPAEFFYPMRLSCPDGSTVELAIEHGSDHNLSVIGRVISEDLSAP